MVCAGCRRKAKPTPMSWSSWTDLMRLLRVANARTLCRTGVCMRTTVQMDLEFAVLLLTRPPFVHLLAAYERLQNMFFKCISLFSNGDIIALTNGAAMHTCHSAKAPVLDYAYTLLQPLTQQWVRMSFNYDSLNLLPSDMHSYLYTCISGWNLTHKYILIVQRIQMKFTAMGCIHRLNTSQSTDCASKWFRYGAYLVFPGE